MRIKELRKMVKMSQVELSRLIGVSQPSLSAWENGTTSPTSDKLPELARILKCEISDLFDDRKE